VAEASRLVAAIRLLTFRVATLMGFSVKARELEFTASRPAEATESSAKARRPEFTARVPPLGFWEKAGTES
jgi:hypothetical protein